MKSDITFLFPLFALKVCKPANLLQRSLPKTVPQISF
jgi:hypothetical protein